MEYIIAHDIGTSSAKASLFSVEGELIASSSVSYETYHAFPSYAEQDADDWWNAFCVNNARLTEHLNGGKVLCVSFSSTYPNCLLVDKDLKPLHRAMIWQDTRATGQAKRISAELPPKYTARAPGKVLSPDRTLPKLLWIKENSPEVFAKAYKMLPCAASYIILKLTGKAVTDYAVSYGTSMIERGSKEWSDEVLSIAGIDPAIMPELFDRSDVVGTVDAEAAKASNLPEGTRIVCGTVDSDCTCIGGGLLNPGDAFLLGGTSAEIDALAPNGRKIGRPTSSSGASLSWLRDNIAVLEKKEAAETGSDVFGLINQAVESAPVGSSGVIFLPYLAGERGMRNDPFARGAFTGISLMTTRECLMRAVVEGIGFNLNLMLQDIRDQGIPVTRLPIVGGLGKGAAVRQVFADIMNVTLVTYEHMDEAAVAGAAVIGGIGLGLYEDVSAVHKFMRPAAETVPDPENHKKYLEIIPRFEEVYQALKTVYKDN